MAAVDEALRGLLAEELCAIIDGWSQIDAAGLLRVQQPVISRLRNGRVSGFSIGRLLRLIARQRHDIEVRLCAYGPHQGRRPPTVTVTRTDMFGMPAKQPSAPRGRRIRSSGEQALRDLQE